MLITVAELENNIDKYLVLASREDIFITKKGKTIAKLTAPYQQKLDIVDSLTSTYMGYFKFIGD